MRGGYCEEGSGAEGGADYNYSRPDGKGINYLLTRLRYRFTQGINYLLTRLRYRFTCMLILILFFLIRSSQDFSRCVQ